MLKLFLWLRYLQKKKIVLLSIAAVGLSVALLIVVDSLFTGYIDGVKESSVVQIGDVFVVCSRSIPQYEKFVEELETIEGVAAAGPFLFGGGLLYLETGDVREVGITGIKPLMEKEFYGWKESLVRQKDIKGEKDVDFVVPGYSDRDGCWLGIGVASEPNEATDEYDMDEVRGLIGKKVTLTTIGLGRKRRTLRLRISDIASTETYVGDRTLYVPYEKYHALLHGDEGGDVTRNIKVKIDDDADIDVMKDLISDKWVSFAHEKLGFSASVIARTRIETIYELRGDFFGELEKQRNVVMLIFMVICSVVVLLIFCIFYMIVETRLKDIAIIKSCGATSVSAATIFLGFGGCIGLVGSILGIVIGAIVTNRINIFAEWIRVVFGMKLWRSSSYGLNTIPNVVHWEAVLPVILLAIAGSMFGALIPAIVAARSKPVDILRYE